MNPTYWCKTNKMVNNNHIRSSTGPSTSTTIKNINNNKMMQPGAFSTTMLRVLVRQPTLFLIILCLIASSASGQESINSILSSLPQSANVTYFTASLSDANLAATFNDTSLNLTLFAPSDSAFLALEGQLGVTGSVFFAPSMAAKWGSNLWRYHSVTPSVTTAKFPNGTTTSWKNAYGSTSLKVTATSSVAPNSTATVPSFKVTSIGSDANIIIPQANISAGQSTIHIIDNVLLPFYISIGSGLSRNSNLSAINSLTNSFANNSAFLSVLNNLNTEYTVLAPVNSGLNNSNTATNSTLTKLLNSTVGLVYFWNYHLIPKPVIFDPVKPFNASANQTVITVTTVAGLPLTLVKDGSTVTVVTPNGNATILSSFNVGLTSSATYRSAIHLISQALVPPKVNTLRDVIALRSDLGTFLSVLGNSSTYGNLLDNSKITGTILAPTNAAFDTFLAKYPGYKLQQFIQGTIGLNQILDAHVLKSTVTLSGLANGISNVTVNQGIILLKANKSSSTGAVKFTAPGGSANSVGSDYFIGTVESGATVIVLDAVLLPQQFDMGAGGAAALATPSPYVVLLSTIVSIAMLNMFSCRHGP